MKARPVRSRLDGPAAGALILLALVLTACTGSPAPSPSASQSGASSSGPTADGKPSAGSPSSTTGPSGGEGDTEDDARFIIDCTGVDGSSSQFVTLQDAWASPNYVRITGCTASPARDGVDLTADEKQIAALVDDGGDPLSDYLQALAACVRIAPDQISAQPTGLLQAVLALCPETPEAGLISSALQDQGAG